MSALKLFTQPAAEPLTMDETKATIRVDATDDDALIVRLIIAARMQAENLTRRALVTQTWELYLEQFPSWSLFLPKPTLQSVTSITYLDELGVTQTLAVDQYLVDIVSEPGRITPAYGIAWPFTRRQMNAVCVRFVAGYGTAADVPASIKNWILMRVGTAYENRKDLEIAYRQTLVQLPPSFIDGLLDPYRVEYFGPLNESPARSAWAGSDIVPSYGGWFGGI